MGRIGDVTVVYVIFVTLFYTVTGDPCYYDADAPCVCRTNNFNLNLQPIIDTYGGRDLQINGEIDYTYYIQPCNRPFFTKPPPCESKPGGPIVSCQVGVGTNVYGLGVFGHYEALKGDQEESYILRNSYTDNLDNKDRITYIKIKCLDTQNAFTYEGSDGPSSPITYTFTIKSTSSCTANAPPSGGVTVSISVGSIMVILFFVLLIVYLTGGVLFLKFVKKLEGTAVIPNFVFWKEIPSLIRDGFLFTFGLCRGRASYGKI